VERVRTVTACGKSGTTASREGLEARSSACKNAFWAGNLQPRADGPLNRGLEPQARKRVS